MRSSAIMKYYVMTFIHLFGASIHLFHGQRGLQVKNIGARGKGPGSEQFFKIQLQ